MTDNTLDVRVYPIDEPKGSTLAFANIAIGDLVAIRGIRVIGCDKGPFVSMPQSKDKDGEYHDVAFPLKGDLRKAINEAVIDEYDMQESLDPSQRGYKKLEKDTGNGRSAAEVKLDVKVFPIAKPKGDTLAFASVGLDGTVAIRGIRIVEGKKRQFVSMPQSKDKDGKYRDIAFPLSGDLRKAISSAVLNEFDQQPGERKQGITERLEEGKAEAAQQAANAPVKPAAKRAPGLGD